MKGRLRNEWAQTADLSPSTRRIGRIMELVMLLLYCHMHKKELVSGKNENLSHHFHLFLFKPDFERSKTMMWNAYVYTYTHILAMLDRLL